MGMTLLSKTHCDRPPLWCLNIYKPSRQAFVMENTRLCLNRLASFPRFPTRLGDYFCLMNNKKQNIETGALTRGSTAASLS